MGGHMVWKQVWNRVWKLSNKPGTIGGHNAVTTALEKKVTINVNFCKYIFIFTLQGVVDCKFTNSTLQAQLKNFLFQKIRNI